MACPDLVKVWSIFQFETFHKFQRPTLTMVKFLDLCIHIHMVSMDLLNDKEG